MKIKSGYTKQELDFDVVEKVDTITGHVLFLIKHDSLRDVVYNQLRLTESGGSVKYNYIKADKDHSVVECVISDGKGRVATEIGEATIETLDNSITISYPTLTASQRAFDRSAILLLMLSGKNLSNNELMEFVPEDYEAVASIPAESIGIMPAEEDVSNTVFVEGIGEMDKKVLDEADEIFGSPDGEDEEEIVVDENQFAEAPISVNQTDNEVETMPAEEETPNNDELANYIPMVGKNKGEKKTIKEIDSTKEGHDYLIKLTNLAKPNPSIVADIEKIKMYLGV